jgi:glycosyltransferase involved in cell wall biosynthesis
MQKSLRRWWVRRATRVIVPSAFLASIVHGWGVDMPRIDLIRNVAVRPVGALPAAAPRRVGLRRVFTAGRLVPWKGFRDVVDVISELPDVHLLIAGDGPDRVRLERSAHQQCPDRVTFLGEVDTRRVWAELSAADVFVLNSTYEGLPHVVLEALSAGTPVVAAAAGGTPELIVNGVNGRLVPPGDHVALREAIGEVLAWRRPRVADEAGATAADTLIRTTLKSLQRAAGLHVDPGAAALVGAP